MPYKLFVYRKLYCNIFLQILKIDLAITLRSLEIRGAFERKRGKIFRRDIPRAQSHDHGVRFRYVVVGERALP